MKYRANPVIVEANRIVQVGDLDCSLPHEGGCNLLLDNGQTVYATPSMLARMVPGIGDYWVIQEDGYVYLNPREVFERKYSRIPDSGVDTEILSDGTVIGSPVPDLRGLRSA